MAVVPISTQIPKLSMVGTTTTNLPSTNVPWMDDTKIFISIAIVFMHVFSAPFENMVNTNSIGWWIGNTYFSAFRWCPGVFVMISGYFLLDPRKDESISVFFKKRAARILIPIISWFVAFSLIIKLIITKKHKKIIGMINL